MEVLWVITTTETCSGFINSLRYILGIFPSRSIKLAPERKSAQIRQLHITSKAKAWCLISQLGTEESHLLVSYQQTVRVFVLTGNFVVWDEFDQLLDEAHHLFVPGDVGHGEAAGRAFSAVRHPLRRNTETITVSSTLQGQVHFTPLHAASYGKEFGFGDSLKQTRPSVLW